MSSTTLKHVDELWEDAKNGTRKLTSTERRRVLVYLQELGVHITNVELSRTFRISERQLREDRKRVLRSLGEDLTPDAQITIVAGLVQEYDQAIGRIKRALATLNPGDRLEREYVETLMKVLHEKRSTYENIGVIRKELGTINVAEEHWIATANIETGELNVQPAPPEDAA